MNKIKIVFWSVEPHGLHKESQRKRPSNRNTNYTDFTQRKELWLTMICKNTMRRFSILQHQRLIHMIKIHAMHHLRLPLD